MLLPLSTKSPKACEPHLVDTVQELQEDGGEAAALAAQRLRPPVAEPVAERQPLLLHQQPEAVERPVVGVGQQLHQRHHLQACRGVTDSVKRSLSGRETNCEGAVNKVLWDGEQKLCMKDSTLHYFATRVFFTHFYITVFSLSTAIKQNNNNV